MVEKVADSLWACTPLRVSARAILKPFVSVLREGLVHANRLFQTALV